MQYCEYAILLLHLFTQPDFPLVTNQVNAYEISSEALLYVHYTAS